MWHPAWNINNSIDSIYFPICECLFDFKFVVLVDSCNVLFCIRLTHLFVFIFYLNVGIDKHSPWVICGHKPPKIGRRWRYLYISVLYLCCLSIVVAVGTYTNGDALINSDLSFEKFRNNTSVFTRACIISKILDIRMLTTTQISGYLVSYTCSRLSIRRTNFNIFDCLDIFSVESVKAFIKHLL